MKSKEDYQAVTDKLKELGILYYALDEDEFDSKYKTQYYSTYDIAKWYEYDEDMIELSKAFSNFTFCLHGEGDESGDMWNSYYYQGESEYCPVNITYPKPEKICWED